MIPQWWLRIRWLVECGTAWIVGASESTADRFNGQKKVDKRRNTIWHFLLASCLATVLLSGISARGAEPLPDFTYQGVALHPKDLSWIPTGELEHLSRR